jgi:hypothetical protein
VLSTSDRQKKSSDVLDLREEVIALNISAMVNIISVFSNIKDAT